EQPPLVAANEKQKPSLILYGVGGGSGFDGVGGRWPEVGRRCGYHQNHPDPQNRPYVDGILGLGSGKEGILSQLRELGIIKHAVGYCLSTQGGRYLFLGMWGIISICGCIDARSFMN
nr:aspartic peptidase A1 family [Tanacetum cinerariifolium]